MSQHPHGHYRRYRAGCHCTPCRDANNADARRRRRLIAYGTWEGRVDATGTIRRLRALAIEGWSAAYVAARMGVDPSTIREITRGERTHVVGITARSIAMIYDEIHAEPGPGRTCTTHARKKRWHGPEAWTDDTIGDPAAKPYDSAPVIVDEVAIHRAIRGDRTVRLSRMERSEAVRILTDRGESQEQIAERLGVTDRTVGRWRAIHRQVDAA